MDHRFLDFVHTIDKPGVSRDVLILLLNDFLQSYSDGDYSEEQLIQLLSEDKAHNGNQSLVNFLFCSHNVSLHLHQSPSLGRVYMRSFLEFILTVQETTLLSQYVSICSQFSPSLLQEFMNEASELYISSSVDSPSLPLLRNVALCYSQWHEKPSTKYIACKQFFLHLKDYPSLCPLQTLVSELFVLLVTEAHLSQSVAEVENMMQSVFDMGTEESCMTTALMLRFFYATIPQYTSFTLAHACIYQSLVSDNQGVRKYGIAALRSVIQNIHENEVYQNEFHINEDIWNTYISIYETFDEFPVHLLKSVWSRIEPLQHFIESQTESRAQFPQLTEEWMEILYTRGIKHSNPQVRLFVVSMLLEIKTNTRTKHITMFKLSPQFLVQTLLPNLNDSMFFKGDRYGIGYLITNYFLHYQGIKTTELFLNLLSVLRDSITNPLAVQFILGCFDPSALPCAPHDFHDSINAVGTGNECVTQECIQFVMESQRVPLKVTCDQISSLVHSLLICITTKISRKSLQLKLIRVLLTICINSLNETSLLAVCYLFLEFPWNIIQEKRNQIQTLLLTIAKRNDEYSDSSSLPVTALILCVEECVHPSQGKQHLIQLCEFYQTQHPRTAYQLLHEIRTMLSLFDGIPSDFCQRCVDENLLQKEVQSLYERSLFDEATMIEFFASSLDHTSFIASMHQDLDSTNTNCLQFSLHVFCVVDDSLLPDSTRLIQLLHRFTMMTRTERGDGVQCIWSLLARKGNENETQLFELMENELQSGEQENEKSVFMILTRLRNISKNLVLDRFFETLHSVYDSLRLTPELVPIFMAGVLNPCMFGSPSHVLLLKRICKDLPSSCQKSVLFSSFFCAAIRADYDQLPTYLSIVKYLVMMKEEKDELSTVNPTKTAYARIMVLQLLEEIPPEIVKTEKVKKSLSTLICDLLKEDKQSSCSGNHVLNSEENGTRLRRWQALCVLSKHFSSCFIHEMIDLYRQRFMELCVKDVRSLMELVGMMLCEVSPSVFDMVLLPVLHNHNQQSQCIPSALLIGYFIITHPSIVYSEPILHSIREQFIQSTVPWILAPEGMNRTVAQVILSDLLEKNPEYTHDDTIRVILGMLKENKRILAMRRKQKMILSRMNPHLEASVSGLLHSNQNNLNDFEPEMLLEEMRLTMEDILSEWYREDYPEQNSHVPTQQFEEPEAISNDFQKKILPWSEVGKDEVEKRKKQSVIVVATFVDKLPNLGGLARTSEIFAVDTLVVRSLQVCRDQVFKSTSVTADEWIDMKEVDEKHLPEYLQQLKRDGWSLVGLEQTMSSVDLREAVFPEKMVLILGNEKEGVPAEIIQMLDLCIEIPQLGIIRSLNVHVSGSILLWEYTRQMNPLQLSICFVC